MMDPFGDTFEDDTTGTTFRDVILLALIGFVAMVVMLLPHIHKNKTEAEDYKPPGNVIVEIHWPDDMPYDVDLWVKAPAEQALKFCLTAQNPGSGWKYGVRSGKNDSSAGKIAPASPTVRWGRSRISPKSHKRVGLSAMWAGSSFCRPLLIACTTGLPLNGAKTGCSWPATRHI